MSPTTFRTFIERTRKLLEKIYIAEVRDGIIAGSEQSQFPDGWFWGRDDKWYGPFPNQDVARERALAGRERAIILVLNPDDAVVA